MSLFKKPTLLNYMRVLIIAETTTFYEICSLFSESIDLNVVDKAISVLKMTTKMN